MSTPAPPKVASTPMTTSVFDKILLGLEIATEVMAVVPSPAMPFAAIALKLEQIIGASIKAKAAASGQTVEQVIAQLHQIAPVE